MANFPFATTFHEKSDEESSYENAFGLNIGQCYGKNDDSKASTSADIPPRIHTEPIEIIDENPDCPEHGKDSFFSTDFL